MILSLDGKDPKASVVLSWKKVRMFLLKSRILFDERFSDMSRV